MEQIQIYCNFYVINELWLCKCCCVWRSGRWFTSVHNAFLTISWFYIFLVMCFMCAHLQLTPRLHTQHVKQFISFKEDTTLWMSIIKKNEYIGTDSIIKEQYAVV